MLRVRNLAGATLALLALPTVAGFVPAAQASTSVFVSASVPAGTSDAVADRALAITRSGVTVAPGDTVTLTASGLANGNQGGNVGPTGLAGVPVDDGEFPDIAGPAANLYSLVGRVDGPGDEELSGIADQWFAVGNAVSFTAATGGELIFLFDDAIYRTPGGGGWSAAYEDNTGGFNVGIDVDPACATSGVFQEPINAAGSRSSFRLGSTIPVKVVLLDCDDAALAELAPTIEVVQLDTSSGSVNEVPVAEVATNGRTMTWNGSHHQFNLSTRRSQFNGGADLTAGTYRITVSDPALTAPVTVEIDLR